MNRNIRMANTVICLLRNDLRYHDNEILHWAHANAAHIIPLYCVDPRHFKGTYHFGFPKTGTHRAKFLLACVQDLRNTLVSHGSDLVVRTGKPEDVVCELVQKLGKDAIKAVTFHQEVTQEELDVEKAIQQNCDVQVQTFWGATLYHKSDIPFSIKQLPNVYTEFRKATESRSRVRPVFDMPDKLKPLPPGVDRGEIPTLESLGLKDLGKDERSAFPFDGGESVGLARLDHYLWGSDSVASYKETRNGMIGTEFSTKFSPWLALGSLSPRQIFREIKRYEKQRTANNSTYWVIFELLWRDYFRYVAAKFGNQIFQLEGLQGDRRIEWKQDKKLFEAWKEGRTGVPYVDANMREMAATGFMSNRGRQNVASFLTKDLKLDWRLGAEWFESQLVDHDVCSNYGNWLYSAGVGNDPRENRKFNMIKQGLDYDPQGEYIRLWIPELRGLKGGEVHTPWNCGAGTLSRAGISLGEAYPNPIVVAPEWNKHTKRQKSGQSQARGKQRGMDFYFKGGSNPR